MVSGETAKILFFYEKSPKSKWDKEYAKRVLKISDKKYVRPVSSWQDLAREISKYSKIDRLVLSFHGGPGALVIGSHYRDLNSSDVKKLFVRKGNPRKVPRGAKKKTKVKPGKPTTKIEAIDFESCNVAQKPDYMVEFGKIFSAKTVAGWTYFRIMNFIEVTLYKGTKETTIKELLKPYNKYLLPGNPTPEQMVQRTKTRDRTFSLLCMWFREVYSDDKPPSRPNERDFKPSSGKGVERTIESSEAKTVANEFTGIITPFHHITVRISY